MTRSLPLECPAMRTRHTHAAVAGGRAAAAGGAVVDCAIVLLTFFRFRQLPGAGDGISFKQDMEKWAE